MFGVFGFRAFEYIPQSVVSCSSFNLSLALKFLNLLGAGGERGIGGAGFGLQGCLRDRERVRGFRVWGVWALQSLGLRVWHRWF